MIKRKMILSLNSHQTTKMMLRQIRKLKMMTQATLKRRKVDPGQDLERDQDQERGQDLKKDQDQERDQSQEESLAPDQERDPDLDQDEGQDQDHVTEGDQDLFEDDHAHAVDHQYGAGDHCLVGDRYPEGVLDGPRLGEDHGHVRDLCHVGEIGTDLLEDGHGQILKDLRRKEMIALLQTATLLLTERRRKLLRRQENIPKKIPNLLTLTIKMSSQRK